MFFYKEPGLLAYTDVDKKQPSYPTPKDSSGSLCSVSEGHY